MSTEQLTTFSENLLGSDIIAKPADGREFLYSTDIFVPVSTSAPIVWTAGEHPLEDVPDIIDKGDRLVSRLIMEAIMAWDPYGVIFLPAELHSTCRQLTGFYIMSVNNTIDVINDEESFVFTRDKSHLGLPPKVVVSELYISESKYNAIEPHKKHIFRVQGSDDTIFFSTELVDNVWEIAEKNGAVGLVQEPFNFDEEAPVF
ncbi:hypothetical protein CGK39_16730 [Vibrio parahaemolyticus]|uniref:imm11 family protein n=1 Tax=Vibrio parahaemolyticus TaxID=670 RepID=UPI0011203B7E|nr:DUF1629 domain-containing protein [Vibrio parahaemolyticus]TNZ82449.1 hypothetical protein CGK39_16730 [Vibrio parahaemolyticus]